MSGYTNYAVMFANSVAFGDAGWLITKYFAQNSSYLNAVGALETKTDSGGAETKQLVQKIYRTNQVLYQCTLWTAYNVAPTSMLTVADMPALSSDGGTYIVDWACTGFIVKFDQQNLVYNCYAQYEAYGAPKSTKPMKIVVPDLEDFEKVVPPAE